MIESHYEKRNCLTFESELESTHSTEHTYIGSIAEYNKIGNQGCNYVSRMNCQNVLVICLGSLLVIKLTIKFKMKEQNIFLKITGKISNKLF